MTDPELDGGKPRPTDKYATDHQRVQSEIKSSDDSERQKRLLNLFRIKPAPPLPRPLVELPRSNFEDADLNAMVDLVQHGNPADMENAGKALWDARDALKDAAKELEGHVKELTWTGEAADEFRSFGAALIAHTHKLSDFADAAGTQITVAGSGLKSVHSSMPPRDSRLEKKRVEDLPPEKRVQGNPEYDAAVKVEGHRQEAVNQLNRLSSFYQVAGSTLAGQEPPVFDRPLNVNMPQPTLGYDKERPTGSARGDVPSSLSSGSSPASSRTELTSGGRVVSRAESLGHAVPPSAPDTSMAIDGVTAPPTPTTTPDTTPLSPSHGRPSGPTDGFTPPPPGRFGNNKGGGGPRSFTSSPPERSGPAVGRAIGNPGGGRESTGRTGPVGRPSGMGGGPDHAGTGRTNTPGISGGTAQSPPGGRASTTGHPMGGGQAGTGGGSGSRSGRSSGIVGGNPQRATSGSSGSRIPRGTVVGAEGATSGRPAAGRAGQPGVVGANPVNRAAGPGGRGTASSKGVVGTPRGSTPGARPGTRGFTQGGAGLVRGPGGRNQSEDDEPETGGSRPDYLTEDEETWTAGGRTIVPPVIE